jgi:hypothetical protein
MPAAMTVRRAARRSSWEGVMLHRISVGAALAVALGMAVAVAQAADDKKHPDWTGSWVRLGGGQFDPSKPGARGQDPPLTAEYSAIWDAAFADEAAGGQQYNPQVQCLPSGMPRMMIAYEPLEIIVTPETTYFRFLYMNELRRIFTDGRPWPRKIAPAFAGYSIGRWIDEDGDGKYDVLVVETRGFRGPRVADVSGIPMHKDNETVIKERIYPDKADPNVVHDEITTIDNALTRPWTIKRSYRRERKPLWMEYVCGEGNHHVFIGPENYVVSADGYLMPTKKDQAPPDLRYFTQSQRP